MNYSKELSIIRKNIIKSIQNTDSGHLGPSFSCLEILYTILKKYINYKKFPLYEFDNLIEIKLYYQKGMQRQLFMLFLIT